MPCCKGMHGGARLGAGRPRVDTKEAKVRLTPQECLALKEAGGSRWVRRQLQVMEEMAMMDLELAHYTEEEKKAFAQGWKAAGGFLDDLGNPVAPQGHCRQGMGGGRGCDRGQGGRGRGRGQGCGMGQGAQSTGSSQACGMRAQHRDGSCGGQGVGQDQKRGCCRRGGTF